MKPRAFFRCQCLNWAAGLLLAYALLVSQTLGLMHAVTHTDGIATNRATGVPHVHTPDAAVSLAGDWLVAFFSKHQSGSDCRIFDHTSQIDVLLCAAPGLFPTLMPSFEVAIFEGEALARWAALFDARGPPLTL